MLPNHKNNERVLGLYQGTFDCFLFFLTDKEKADQVKLLASSKYPLLVCDITAATKNIKEKIDNSCCERWTIDPLGFDVLNYSKSRLITEGKNHKKNNIFYVTTIKKIKEQTTNHIQIKKEIGWIKTLSYWTEFLNYLLANEKEWKEVNCFIEETMDLYELSDTKYTKTVVKKINQLLYLNTESLITQREILKLIKTHPDIYEKHNEWIYWSQFYKKENNIS
jgi:hypothetical protein